MTGQLALEVTGTTVAQDNVVIEGDPELTITAGLEQLTVERAEAKIPRQELPPDTLTIDFPDDRIQVTTAEIRRGGLDLTVRNDVPIIVSLNLTSNDLFTPEGDRKTIEITGLEPEKSVTIPVDLDNHTFTPENLLQISVTYEAVTDSSGDFVPIRSDAKVIVSAETQDLEFGEINGRLANLSLPIAPVTQTLDIPPGLENVGIGNTSLQAWVTTAVGFRSQIDLLIEGTKGNESRSFTVSETFAAGERDPNDDTQIIESHFPVGLASDELTPFLNFLPTSITVTPTILVGDGTGDPQFISPEQWVQVDSVVFRSDAAFEIREDDRIEVDPEFQQIDDPEARTRISNNLKTSSVTTKITNRIPIGVRVSLRAASNIEDVYKTELINKAPPVEPDSVLAIPTDGSAFGVEAATVDESGRAIAPSSTEPITVALSREDILVFLREEGVYTGVLIEFDKTENEATDNLVQVFGSDFVEVQAALEVVIELNESLVD